MIKEGKLFGKINLLDAIVVVLLVILIVAGMMKFRTLNQTVDYHTAGKITYQMEINNVRDYTYAALQPGDAIFDPQTGNHIGTIVKVESGDATTIKALSDGTSIVSKNVYRKNIFLTIETPGSSTDSGFFANRSIELKTGSEKKIETLYAAFYAKITKIEYQGE